MVLIGCLFWGFIGLGFSIWDTKCEFIPFADSPELPMFSLSYDQRSWVDALNENHFRPKFTLAVSKNPFKGFDNWAGFVPWTLLTFANMPRVGNQDDDEKIGCHGKDKLKVHNHHDHHYHRRCGSWNWRSMGWRFTCATQALTHLSGKIRIVWMIIM